MSKSFSSPHKILIRKNWGKPILQYLTQNLGAKLIYLGLPASEAEDIKEWIEFIRIVYAFQCRKYPEPSDPDQLRDEIERLEFFLLELESRRLIETFSLFDGYIEEVVLNEQDLIGQPFIQDDYVTVYNLDFCNKITSPFEFVSQEGDLRTVYKFDAIDKLLQFQHQVNSLPSRFVLFLTIHCSYDDDQIQQFLREIKDQSMVAFHNKCKSLGGQNTKSRLIKSFVYHRLSKVLNKYQFEFSFFPTILYSGLGGQKMLHFTLVARKNTDAHSGVKSLFYYIAQKFITPQSQEFTNVLLPDASLETDVVTDPFWHLDHCPLFQAFTESNGEHESSHFTP